MLLNHLTLEHYGFVCLAETFPVGLASLGGRDNWLWVSLASCRGQGLHGEAAQNGEG